MKFLYILEGKIGRIDRNVTNEDIIGLCTDNITSCNIIVLISADKKRYVLIHVDTTINSQIIANEIAWVGAGGSHFVLRRAFSGFITQSSADVKTVMLTGIKDKFTEQLIGNKDEVVSIQVGDLKPKTTVQLPANVEYHPQAKLLFAIGVEYEILGSQSSHSKSLLFNTEEWTDYGSIDLSQHALRTLKQQGITEKSSAVTIYHFFVNWLENAEDAFILHAAAKLCIHFYLKSAKNPSKVLYECSME